MIKLLAFIILFSVNFVYANSFCDKLDLRFKEFKWGTSKCTDYSFKEFGKTASGEPLVYTVINPDKKETLLFMCGVHGDEITPIKFCFDLLKEVDNYKEKRVIIAPVVSPDSFFKTLKRTNSNGVDVNRNFPTKDWTALALKQWQSKYRKDKRRYPGPSPASEIETRFQVYLVETYIPSKIFSVHAPLQVFDYDGPTISHNGSIHEGKKLLDLMSEESKNYRKGKLNTYPGSLGNWAGREKEIPTYTLELPSSNPAKHAEYWRLFKPAVEVALKK